MSPRLRGWLLGGLFAATVVVVYSDPLFGPRTFVGRDIVPYGLPLEKAVHDAWSRGRIPVWWESVSGGRPLAGNPNAGIFYPLRPALAGLPFPAAARTFPIVHWVLGGLGMILLLRSIGGSHPAAWIAAVSFAFSGVLVSEVFYSAFQPGASLLPWALWGMTRPARSAAGRVVPLSVVIGAMLLAGDVFSIVMAVAAAALWVGLEMPAGERSPRWLGLALSLGVALLLALPQVLATGLLAVETRRTIGGLSLADVTGFTLPVWRLAELVVPYPFGPIWQMDSTHGWGVQVFRHLFVTLFVGPIALAGLFRGLHNPSRGWRFARALVIGCLLLTLSGHLVPASWGHFPSPIPLRYPEKFALGAAFGLSVSAGIAIDRLRRFRSGGRGLLIVSAVVTLLAAAAALAPHAAGRLVVGSVGGAPELVRWAALELPAGLAVAGLFWVFTAVAADLAARSGRAPYGAALVLLTLVPLLANRPIAQTAHEGTVFPPTPFARTIAGRDPAGAFRTVDESLYQPPSSIADAAAIGVLGGSEFFRQGWFYFTPTLGRRGTVLNSDLDAGDLSRIESLRKISSVAAAQPDSAGFFSTLSLRYGIRYRDQKPLAGFRPFGGDAFRTWDENPGALPDLRLPPRWREVPGPVEALISLPRLPSEEIVVETGRLAEGRARPGRIRVLERSPERLVVEAESPDPAWLFVLRGDWSYRSVSIDGRPVETKPAQLAFTGVPIPAGRHRLEWREGFPGLALSRWGPLAGLVLLVAFRRARWVA